LVIFGPEDWSEKWTTIERRKETEIQKKEKKQKERRVKVN